MNEETKIIKWYSENLGIIRIKNPILKKRIKDNQDKTSCLNDELADISFNPNDYQYNPFDFGIIQYTQEECIKKLDKIGQKKDFIVTYGIACIFGDLVLQKVHVLKIIKFKIFYFYLFFYIYFFFFLLK
jgi:hypothetical protein